MAEKKKAKKSNSAQHWDLTVRCPGVVTREGVVAMFTSTAVILNTRRDGSSLRQKISVPRNKIVLVVGSLTEGSEAKIIYRDERAPIGRKMTRVTMDDAADKDTGMLKGQNEQGLGILVNPEFADLVTRKDTEVEAPEGVVVKKKKKVAAA